MSEPLEDQITHSPLASRWLLMGRLDRRCYRYLDRYSPVHVDGCLGSVSGRRVHSFFSCAQSRPDKPGTFFALHGYLLYRYGQTIGKHCVDTAIVKTNDEPPDVKTIALRYLPVWGVSSIPMIGGLLSLVDVLFIARDDKRCVHDLIAGTKVVNVEDTPQEAEAGDAPVA